MREYSMPALAEVPASANLADIVGRRAAEQPRAVMLRRKDGAGSWQDVIAEQFKGRLDLAKYNGDDSGELPLGATYVVDREGIIRYAFVDADYRKRAEPSDVIAALRRLDKKPLDKKP